MEPPIILWEAGDLTIFPTIEEAEAGVEPWWRNEPISICDRVGRRLVIEVVKRRCKLREAELGKIVEAELRQALLQYLAACRIRDHLSERSTDELITMATPFAAEVKPRYGVLADFVIDILRSLVGKPPLHAMDRSDRERTTS